MITIIIYIDILGICGKLVKGGLIVEIFANYFINNSYFICRIWIDY